VPRADGGEGFLYVAYRTRKAVFRVDLVSGDRTIIADDVQGSGPLWTTIGPIAWAGGALYVGDLAGVGQIIRVDPATRARTLVSAPGVGTGPSLPSLNQLVAEPAGSLLYNQYGSLTVGRIDLETGDRTVIWSQPWDLGSIAVVPEPEADPCRAAALAAVALLARRRSVAVVPGRSKGAG
jgi:hypothetical protein